MISSVKDIIITEISPSRFNPRNGRNGIDELADSIRRNGILHPITVRVREEGFEIVAGNRRYYACKKLGWRKIPCNITDLDDKRAYEISIIENVQRKTLDAVEEAYAFRKYVVEYGWGGVSDLAERLSKSPSYVTKRIKLTELPADVLEMISESELPVTAAEELLYVKNNGERSRLAALISKQKISTRRVRAVVKEISGSDSEPEYRLTNKDEIGISHHDKILQVMDRTIIVLRTAMGRMSGLIENLENNWLFYDLLMQHKNMINLQIDLLIRQKRKSRKVMSTRFRT